MRASVSTCPQECNEGQTECHYALHNQTDNDTDIQKGKYTMID